VLVHPRSRFEQTGKNALIDEPPVDLGQGRNKHETPFMLQISALFVEPEPGLSQRRVRHVPGYSVIAHAASRRDHMQVRRDDLFDPARHLGRVESDRLTLRQI